MSDDLTARLAGFLAKIQGRADEILAEALEGCRGLMEEFPEDPVPLGNALQAIKVQIQQLRQRIDEAWDGQIGPMFAARGSGAEDRARDHVEAVKIALDERFRRFEVERSAELYRALVPRARKLLEQPIRCPRCGGIVRESGVRVTTAATCPTCGAAVQCVPEPAVRMVFGGGAGHAWGEEAALPLRLEIEKFRREVDRKRAASGWAREGLASLERWEAMERAAWERYAEVRGAASGEPPDRELVESRMAAFRRYNLETEPEWRAAHPG